MGLERTIRTSGPPLDWPALVAWLRLQGQTPVLRMIDGLPAFPDESPADGWQELRVGLNGGMATLRRVPEGYSVVTWGTADAVLQQSADDLIRAVRELCGENG